MNLEIPIAKSGRRIKLWQLLLAVAVVGTGLGLLPERIGIPVLLLIEGALIVGLLFFLVVAICRRVARK